MVEHSFSAFSFLVSGTGTADSATFAFTCQAGRCSRPGKTAPCYGRRTEAEFIDRVTAAKSSAVEEPFESNH